ncbi:hypothetical protein MIT9_P1883 [Methylomarinovum caldicuralii]|uniref:DUF4340 domain-containing protein n=1 Tax=Methylomarinovum caldicuralii TaxID=438856 RepID=A0AAU9CWE6_9GAMM|nr:DUF4340 domain-containing protein [Methylomarinovum caldicuralii]BCX82297.1 hypothetical protein MIT9_P1883 [Methylomarinovum caldicuralii]
MRHGWLTIAVLFLLVAGLGGWVWWLQRQPQEARKPALADIDPKTVRHITVRHDATRIVFERSDGGWRMRQPYEARADSYRIEQVLALPKTESQASYQVSGDELRKFGLEPPRAEVVLEKTPFRFGNQNPIDFRRYVQTADGRVHLIEDTLFHLLTSPPTDWIDTRLLPEDELQELALPGWHLSRTEKGGWRAEPELAPERLQRWVDAWRLARAIQIGPFEGPVPTGKPEIRIRVDGREIRFLVLQREPELILLRPERKLRYHFYGQSGRRLLQPPQAAGD